MAKSRSPVEPNLLDRVIGYVSPKRAVRRMRDRAAMAYVSGYVGARYDRNSMRSWFTTTASADTDTIYDLRNLRGRSRDLVRNTPVATGAVGTMVSNVVGSGLSLMCRPDYEALKMTEDEADEFGETVEREFRLWAQTAECDITRTQTFYGLQSLAFRSLLESGDTFALLPMLDRGTSPYQLKVQLIEADRVDIPGGNIAATGVEVAPGSPQNKIVGGVEIDETGAPVAYHIATQHPGDIAFSSKMKWIRVPAFGAKTKRRNVVHIFDRLRPGQSRGVPYLAPVMECLKQLDRYTEAELMGAVVSAMFTVFVKTQGGDGLSTEAGFADDQIGPSSNTTLVDPRKQIGLGNGSIVDLVPGEDVSFADPKRPNTAFDGFVTSILRQIGVSLGLPYEVLVKHFTASYSASRAALIQAWQVFKQRRDFIATGFCDHVYEAFMEEAVAIGRIDAPGFFDDPAIRRAYLECDWVGDAPGQIDPLKEIQAAELRTEVGVSDLAAECMELRGKVWKDVHRQQVKEKAARVAGKLESEITAIVPPKVAKGEGLNTPAKTDPNIPPQDQPGQGSPQGSDLEKGDEEK
jgi:lambda family phage portal protein